MMLTCSKSGTFNWDLIMIEVSQGDLQISEIEVKVPIHVWDLT